VQRWDTETCDGGLRWQIFPFNVGYNYKQSFTGAAFFQLAARLAQYTGNQTYADWAERQYDWMTDVGLIARNGAVYDGTDVNTNCSQLNHIQWTYNPGALIYGSAVMYNITGANATWSNRLTTLLNATSVFVEPGSRVIYEAACEISGTCNTDQFAMKSLYVRDLALTTVSAPFTADAIAPLLQRSAQAAAASCITASNGTQCGSQWTLARFDGTTGLGQQLSALSVIQNLLVGSSPALRTSPGMAHGTAGGNGTLVSGGNGTLVSGGNGTLTPGANSTYLGPAVSNGGASTMVASVLTTALLMFAVQFLI